jgi:hypothetical protein
MKPEIDKQLEEQHWVSTDPNWPPADMVPAAHRKKASHRGLRCYLCGGKELAVKDSRPSRNAVRRRRRCLDCGAKFTTFEIMSPTQDDTHRIYDALHYYDALSALPAHHREAVLAMVKALSPDHPNRQSTPLIGSRTPNQLLLDAALVGGDAEEEARFG